MGLSKWISSLQRPDFRHDGVRRELRHEFGHGRQPIFAAEIDGRAVGGGVESGQCRVGVGIKREAWRSQRDGQVHEAGIHADGGVRRGKHGGQRG